MHGRKHNNESITAGDACWPDIPGRLRTIAFYVRISGMRESSVFLKRYRTCPMHFFNFPASCNAICVVVKLGSRL
eukprot:2281867-Alexandrium_andersonii.AAC.1